jgi:alkanesulfonate monooxygenase SsuD/methylene tetrahydromethanopterin reductase-like flavin-dependent oxidoreductase (luciferase family)
LVLAYFGVDSYDPVMGVSHSVGYFLPTFGPGSRIDLGRIRAVAVRAEKLGFTHLWAGDHLLWKGGMLAPFPVLSYLAACTRKIGLGTGVYLLPLRHPVVTAREATAVDFVSGGRLCLGVGIGGENPREYESVGLDVHQRGARMDEVLASFRFLLNGERGQLDDELIGSMLDLRPDPPPAEKVPLWVAGRSDAAIRRAIQHGDGWFPMWVTPDAYKVARQRLSVASDERPFTYGLNVFVNAGETTEVAREQAGRYLQDCYGLPYERLSRYVVAGTPAEVATTLERYFDAGVQHLALNPASADVEGQLDALAGIAHGLI